MMERPPVMNRERGFTLIEVMVVVVILGLLAAIIVPKVMSRPDEARAVAAKADVAAISQALKLYRLDNVTYPSTEQGLQALVARPATQPVPVNWKQGGDLDPPPASPCPPPPAGAARPASPAGAPPPGGAAKEPGATSTTEPAPPGSARGGF